LYCNPTPVWTYPLKKTKAPPSKAAWLVTFLKSLVKLKPKPRQQGARHRLHASLQPTTRESEIIVFKGKVEFANKQRKDDKKLVKTGQWGGVGGRYRDKIGDLIDLPESILDTFDKASSF